jgi:hypothetical protein
VSRRSNNVDEELCQGRVTSSTKEQGVGGLVVLMRSKEYH